METFHVRAGPIVLEDALTETEVRTSWKDTLIGHMFAADSSAQAFKIERHVPVGILADLFSPSFRIQMMASVLGPEHDDVERVANHLGFTVRDEKEQNSDSLDEDETTDMQQLEKLDFPSCRVSPKHVVFLDNGAFDRAELKLHLNYILCDAVPVEIRFDVPREQYLQQIDDTRVAMTLLQHVEEHRKLWDARRGKVAQLLVMVQTSGVCKACRDSQRFHAPIPTAQDGQKDPAQVCAPFFGEAVKDHLQEYAALLGFELDCDRNWMRFTIS
ncbi:MAG: hypothetical protein MHM6MM_003526 [Cercozoa sp. M6MM]